MKNIFKKGISAVLAAGMLVSMAGCGEKKTATDNVKLNWMVMTPEQTDSQKVWAEFNKQLAEFMPGVEVEFIPVAYSEYKQRFDLALAGGQQIDLENEGKDIDLLLLQALHAKKTGALIKCACVLGCIAAGVEEDTPEYKSAVDYAASLGIAFQIADDILDVIGDEKKLGKKCGSDKKDHKNTYVTLLGLEQSKVLARELALSARTAVGAYDGSRFLCELADYTITRGS